MASCTASKASFMRQALLLAILIINISAHSNGLEVTLHRGLYVSSADDVCGQLTCQTKGNTVTIDSVTLSRVKATGGTTLLLSVSRKKPKVEVIFDNIRGAGTLENDSAEIVLSLSGAPGCDVDSFICKVASLDRSSIRKTAFAMVGPELPPSLVSEVEAPTAPLKLDQGSCTSGTPYLAELGFLGDKVAKTEKKCQLLGDRLDEKLTQKMDDVDRRIGNQGNDLRERVVSLETGVSARVSKVEDRLTSLLLAQTPTSSRQNVAAASLDHLEGRLADLAARLDQINGSDAIAGENANEQPWSCVRGMGDDVIKTYPRYIIVPNDVIKQGVLCDTHTSGGGWIVIQRRTKGDVDFYRDWTSYREGFGSPTGDFWLGNEAIHQLTDGEAYELRVDIRFKDQELYAHYATFRIEDEINKYRLHVDQFVGTAFDAMATHNTMPFSTFDRDNDVHTTLNCAVWGHGGWWYKECYEANLNGKWGVRVPKGIVWNWEKDQVPVTFSEMKIRRVKG